MEWFYANEKDEQIRILEEDFERLVRLGVVKKDTLVWTESMADWDECQKVKPELFGAAPASPAASEEKPPPSAAKYLNIGQESSDQPAITPPPPPPDDPGSPPAIPNYVYGVKPPGPADGLATGSLICGIVGLVATLCSGLGLPVSIAAVVCAHKGKTKLREAGLLEDESKLTAGLVTGWIGVVIGGIAALGIIAYIILVGTAIASEI